MFSREDTVKSFGVKADMSADMYSAIRTWVDVYTNSKANIGASICNLAASMAMTDFTITISNNGNGSKIQQILDDNYSKLQQGLEKGLALGDLLVKPTYDGIDKFGIDFITANNFAPIEFYEDGDLKSVVIEDSYAS